LLLRLTISGELGRMHFMGGNLDIQQCLVQTKPSSVEKIANRPFKQSIFLYL